MSPSLMGTQLLFAKLEPKTFRRRWMLLLSIATSTICFRSFPTVTPLASLLLSLCTEIFLSCLTILLMYLILLTVLSSLLGSCPHPNARAIVMTGVFGLPLICRIVDRLLTLLRTILFRLLLLSPTIL